MLSHQNISKKSQSMMNLKLENTRNYYTRDKLEIRKYRMIDGIKDILDICQNEIGEEKYTMILKYI